MKQKIQQLYTYVNAHRPLNGQEVEKLLAKLSLEQNYKSNAIEGSQLSLSETEMVIVHAVGVAKPLRDINSAVSHQRAWEEMLSIVTEPRTVITKDFILQLHSIITQDEPASFPGEFRTKFVRIKRSKVLLPHPVEVDALMTKLLHWLHTTNEHPLDIIVNFHQRFIRIHPFTDGNGRTCRLLCTLLALQDRYGPVVLHGVTTQSYFNAIRAWEQERNVTPFGELIWKDMLYTLSCYKAAYTKEFCFIS
jgi:Fic family protein